MKKFAFLFFSLLLLLIPHASFAEHPKKITFFQKFQVTTTSTKVYSTECTLNFFNKTAYLPAKVLGDVLGGNAKWYRKENVYAIVYGNIYTCINPRKKTAIIQKHNRLYKLSLSVVEKNSSLYVPLEVLKIYNLYNSENSTATNVYIGVTHHVYEKALDAFVSKALTFAKKSPRILSQYSTYFNPGYVNRTANIYQAASYLNGLIIPAGQIFSFNKTLGPRTARTGYKKAIIFFKKEKKEDYGGGICQVSSTIFNAVYKAKLRILERKSHSLDVTYVPKGMDATVSYGYIDFVFKNIKPYPIILTTKINKNRFEVKILRY